MKNLLQDQNPEERKKALEEMADIKEMQNVRRYYSADLLKSCAEEIINTELKRFPEAIVKIEQ